MTATADELLRRLELTRGDASAQAAVTAEFLLLSHPEADREWLRRALDAAAVLHWFDPSLLALLLNATETEAQSAFAALKTLPFVEWFRRGQAQLHSVHDATRRGWRKQLAHENPKRFKTLSSLAAGIFAIDTTPPACVEWIYHRLSSDPDAAATELEALNRVWSSSAHSEHYEALARALEELEHTAMVEGRARAWVQLTCGWSRYDRGDTAQLTELADRALSDAIGAGDEAAESDAQCLLGAALEAQGSLGAAQTAFEESGKILRRLVERDPNNTGWQRELAVAYGWAGRVQKALGKLEAAQAAFEQHLGILRRLAEQDPNNMGWQRELGRAHTWAGRVLEAQDRPEEAQAAIEQSVAIMQRLVEKDPSNERWQRDLGAAHRQLGDVLEAQGEIGAAQSAFEKDLEISRRLVERDVNNHGWQQELAEATGRSARIARKTGRPAVARTLYEEAARLWGGLQQRGPVPLEAVKQREAIDAELLAIRAAMRDATTSG